MAEGNGGGEMPSLDEAAAARGGPHPFSFSHSPPLPPLPLPSLTLFPFPRSPQDAMEMEPFEANFMFSIAIARMLHFIFWVSSYHELNDRYGDGLAKKYPGHLVVFAQVVNLLVMGDYILHHVIVARRAQLLPRSF